MIKTGSICCNELMRPSIALECFLIIVTWERCVN
jgi:hypothetical protein